MVPHQLGGKCGLSFMVSRDECKFCYNLLKNKKPTLFSGKETHGCKNVH